MQTFPGTGPALPLAAGRVYAYAAETTGASGADGFFYMDESAPVAIKVPDLCESDFVGNVKPVKCSANEPFIEPKDLEEFVRENRVQK